MMKEQNNRILVVDDEALVLGLCEKTLSQMGLYVETARAADEALVLMEEKQFDFVLADIAMPGAFNGVALAEEVRHRWPSTVVVMMTGRPSVESAVSTLKNGASDYLIKPFVGEDLAMVVRRSTEKRRLSREFNREQILRQELEAAYAELQKVERLKDAILSTLSHELRTPLAIALSATSIIAEETIGAPQTKKFLDILSSSLARESDVVEELLLFAKVQSQNLRMDKSRVRLRDILDQIIEDFKSRWEERGLDIRVSWESSMRPLWADAKLIQIALKNLFLNAIQFNNKGGKIFIRGAETSEGVKISFSDTGIGIPQDKLPLLSDSFYQAADHLTRTVGGLGLGLAIVRRIVEAHGGNITVESKEGEGSNFTIRLPRQNIKSRKGGIVKEIL